MTTLKRVETKREQASRHMRAYRLRKRTRGICLFGGCWEVVTESRLCPKHSEYMRTASRAFRSGERGLIARIQKRLKAQQRREQGLCFIPSCINYARPDRSTCEYHKEHYKQLSNARRAKQIKQRLCLYGACQLPPIEGHKLCAEHRAKMVSWQRASYARHVSEGRCRNCGKPAVTSSECETHRTQHLLWIKMDKEHHKVQGLCTATGCKEKPLDSYTVCAYHLGLLRKNMLAYRTRGLLRNLKGLCFYPGCPNPLVTTRLCEMHNQRRLAQIKARIQKKEREQ